MAVSPEIVLRYTSGMTAKLTKELAAALHATGDRELKVIDPDTSRVYFIVASLFHRRESISSSRVKYTGRQWMPFAISRIVIQSPRGLRRWNPVRGFRWLTRASLRGTGSWHASDNVPRHHSSAGSSRHRSERGLVGRPSFCRTGRAVGRYGL